MRLTGLLCLLVSIGCTDRALPVGNEPVTAADLGVAGRDLAAGGTGGVGGTGADGRDLSVDSRDLSVGAPNDLAARANDLGPTSGPDLASTRTWSIYNGPDTSWTRLINSAAVDSQENLYVSDGQSIFVVRAGVVSVYLSQATIGATSAIQSLDVAPDDTLYFLAGNAIYHATAPEQVALQHQVTAAQVVMWLGVVDDNQALVLDYYEAGLEKIVGATETLLYNGTTIPGATDCSSQSLAVQRDGVFFYLPGCNGSPLLKGNSDGSGAGVLLQSELSPRLVADNFNSVTRDPAGGFVLSVENNAGTWNNALIHCDENGNWFEIVTSPPMGTYVGSIIDDIFEFHSRPVAVGPSGAIYVVGIHSIYRLSP